MRSTDSTTDAQPQAVRANATATRTCPFDIHDREYAKASFAQSIVRGRADLIRPS
jgi:hypothetical protein